ncbi:MAG: small multi-drug export protein [Litorilinea sp.]
MWEYWLAAATAWGIGFFPLAEIYVAVPVAIAAGLDPVSAIFWSVFGNFTPIVLIHWGYERLQHLPWAKPWLQRFTSVKFKNQIDRYGTWIVLLITPWTGVWVMGVSAKVLGMAGRPLLVAGFISLVFYAVILAYTMEFGLSWFAA